MSNKTITTQQGTGDDALEMNVQVTQKEIEIMEQIRRFSPDNWEGKGLELLQEARKVINDERHQDSCDKANNCKENVSHNVTVHPKKRKLVFIIGLWVLLIIYKLCLMILQFEVNSFDALLLRPEYSSLHSPEFIKYTQDHSYFLDHNDLNKTWGTGKDFIDGIKVADYYHLVPFNRLVTASLVINVKNKFGKNRSFKEWEQSVLETKILNVETSYLKSIRPKWYRFGTNMPVIIEVTLWLFLAYLSMRNCYKTSRKRIIKEKVVDSKKMGVTEKPTKKESKNNKTSLWWVLGILITLCVFYGVINTIYGSVRQKKEQSVQECDKETFTYQGVTFNYPGNWSFTIDNRGENVFAIGGENEVGSEFSVICAPDNMISVEEAIDNIVTGFASSEQFSNVEYSAIYELSLNGINMLACDYSYEFKGKNCFSQVMGYSKYGKTFIITSMARTKQMLSDEDFQMMKYSLKYSQQTLNRPNF